MNGQRELFIFHPHTGQIAERRFEGCLPLRDAAARDVGAIAGFGAMIADGLRQADAAHSLYDIGAATPGDHDAGARCGKTGEQGTGPSRHDCMIRIFNDGRQSAVKIESVESAFVGELRQQLAGRAGESVFHAQTVEPTPVRSERRPATRS
jgi:hypothetical protein